jgi:tRNA(His) 5'-end guanylyltransferase
MTDSLGDRMKTYEQVMRTMLLPHSYTVLRVDGRAFHSYLRSAARPFDLDFIADMKYVAQALCHEASGVAFAYGQSDEISLLLADLEPQSQPWFGGIVQKMVSVAAGVATAALIAQRGTKGRPHFDARVFTLPSAVEVANYFIWRQRDAVRNSVSMAAQAKFSPKQLHGVSGEQMQDMLWREYGVNWNDYPEECKRGWVITRSEREAPVTYVDRRTQREQTTVALRTFWEPEPAPHFVVGGDYLTDHIPGASPELQPTT